jgi:hypothetical protein
MNNLQTNSNFSYKKKSDMFALSNSEIQKLEKLCLISKMIPNNLYLQGIFIKSFNDDNRPAISPDKVLKILNTNFDTNNLKDFIVLIVNKITFSKIFCQSANFGDLEYKCAESLKSKHDLIHFSLKANIEMNRLLYIKEKNFSEMIDNFNFSLKNLIDNSFYILYHGAGENKKVQYRSSELLSDKINSKSDQINIKMLMPMNLMDFENFIGKNQDFVEKFLIKFRSKIVLNLYLSEDIKFSELMSEIKSGLLSYIGENIEHLLQDKYLDISSPNIFSYDIDNKYFIEYKDICFTMDQGMSNYTVSHLNNIRLMTFLKYSIYAYSKMCLKLQETNFII